MSLADFDTNQYFPRRTEEAIERLDENQKYTHRYVHQISQQFKKTKELFEMKKFGTNKNFPQKNSQSDLHK